MLSVDPRRIRHAMKSPEEREQILEVIIEGLLNGKSLTEICQSKALPDRATIIRWSNGNDEFAAAIARAREMQADALDDDIADVVADVLSGTVDPQAGRVAIWAHQWRACKMRPKKYGDRIDGTVTFDVGERFGQLIAEMDRRRIEAGSIPGELIADD